MSRTTSATRCSTSGSSTPSSRVSASSAAGLALSRGEIADARLYLRQTPGGEMNIKQIVDRISDPDKPKKGNFRLSLQQGLDREHGPLPRTARPSAIRSYGIDFSHMHLYGITARVDDFTIDGQAIYTTIAAFSARERSGFVLDHLAGRFYMTQGCLGFEDASIVTAAFERPDFPYVSLAGDSWAAVQGFHRRGAHRRRAAQYDRLDRRHRLVRSRSCATGMLDFSDVNVEVAGVVSDFTAEVRSMQIGEGTTLVADAAVKGLPEIRQTRGSTCRFPACTPRPRPMDELALGIAGPQALGQAGRRYWATRGSIDLDARFKGTALVVRHAAGRRDRAWATCPATCGWRR